MRKGLCLFFSALGLHAGILDFWEAKEGIKAYESQQFDKAATHFGALSKEHPSAAYNLGNSYYRQGEYAKALKEYAGITEDSLRFNALHNSGNAHAMLGEIDEAIKAYEEALALKEDAHTRHNLELLKEQKKQQEQNQSSSQSQNSSQNQSSSEGQSSSAQESSASSASQASGDSSSESSASSSSAAASEAPPISEQEERKWDRMLQDRGIQTLMLPLDQKGAKDAPKKPW